MTTTTRIHNNQNSMDMASTFHRPFWLLRVQEAFGSRSRFWSEHGYNSETGTPGYFSYIHRLGGVPTTSIEQVSKRCRHESAHNLFFAWYSSGGPG